MSLDSPDAPHAADLSRRGFLKHAGFAATAGGAVGMSGLAASAVALAQQTQSERVSGEIEIALELNGATRRVKVEPRTTLLSALRDRLDPPLTGAKPVCENGNCGACTVLLDGEPVLACLTLALRARGRKLRTVEGLASAAGLSPLQDEFCKHDALMCGFCTPGFLMSLTGLLERQPNASIDEIKQGCAGNLCRCGTYPHIFDAALAAGRRMSANGGAR